MSAFLGFGTALPEHAVDPEASLAALRGVWPRLGGSAAPEAVSRYTVEPLERVLQPRGLGEAMRTYAKHAPALARLARPVPFRTAMDLDQHRVFRSGIEVRRLYQKALDLRPVG